MDWLRRWQLRRLKEQLVEVNARLDSLAHTARSTGYIYPTEHEDLSARRAVLAHRIAELTLPSPLKGS